MARFNDRGPYRIGNIKIVTNIENRAEQKVTKNTRKKMRLAKLGRKLSAEHRARISKSNTGNKMSARTLIKMREVKLGSLNPVAKLTERKIRFIKACGIPSVTLAKKFNVSTALISMVKNGHRWGHVI